MSRRPREEQRAGQAAATTPTSLRGWTLALALWVALLLPLGAAQAAAPAPVTVRTIIDGYGRGRPFKVPAGVWFDSHRNEIYVADRGNHRIAVFDLDGLFLRSFVHHVPRPDGQPGLQLGEPKGVAVNSRGDMYLVDGLDDAVEVLDYRGRRLRRLRAADLVEPPAAVPETFAPAAVAVDAADRVYLAITGSRCQIVVLDAAGTVLRRLGRRGQGRGEFAAVTGLSVDAAGRLLVTDAQGVPVQCFSPEGEVLAAFGQHAMGPADFSLPNGAVRDGDGAIWVADAIRQVVRRYDATGQLRDTLGGMGRAPGQLLYPVAVAGDGKRLLVVLEKNGARVQVFAVGLPGTTPEPPRAAQDAEGR